MKQKTTKETFDGQKKSFPNISLGLILILFMLAVLQTCFACTRGISTPSRPNISSTIWRTFADEKNKVYFFENTASPSLVWVRLNKIDFRSGSDVRKLTLHGNPDLGGDQAANFRKAEAFRFLGPQ